MRRSLNTWTGIPAMAALAAILGWITIATAQQPDRPPQRGQQGPGQPPGGFGGPQGFGGGFGGPQGFGGGFGMGGNASLTALLRRQDVRKELELLDDQVEQLAQVEETLRERTRQEMETLRNRPQDGDRPAAQPGQPPRPGAGGPGGQEEFRAAMERINQATRDQVAQILLPHQMERLDQLAMQFRLQGGAMAVLNGELIQQLNVSDQQRDQLRAKAEEVERETQRKIAQLRLEAQNQALSVLSPEQQAKFRALVGEPFAFENEPPRLGGPGGPGGGTRPGAPGGGGARRPQAQD